MLKAGRGLEQVITAAVMPWEKFLPVSLHRPQFRGKSMSIFERDHTAVIDEDDLANLLEDDRDIIVDGRTNRMLQRFDRGYIKRRRIRKKKHEWKLFNTRKHFDRKALRRMQRRKKARRLSRWLNRIRHNKAVDQLESFERYKKFKKKQSAFREMQSRFQQMSPKQQQAVRRKRKQEEADVFSAIAGQHVKRDEPAKQSAQLSRFAPQAPPKPHPAKPMLDTKFSSAKDGQSKHDPPAQPSTINSKFGGAG